MTNGATLAAGSLFPQGLIPVPIHFKSSGAMRRRPYPQGRIPVPENDNDNVIDVGSADRQYRPVTTLSVQ